MSRLHLIIRSWLNSPQPMQGAATRRRAPGVLVFALAVALPSLSQAEIYVHDIVTGNLTETHDTDFNITGLGFNSICEVPDRIKGFMDGNTGFEVGVIGSFPILWVVKLNFPGVSNENPTLDGGEFDGMELRDARDFIVGIRDESGSLILQVALLGSTGISTYIYRGGGATNGDFLAVRNPTLSGGDFSGLSFTDIPVTDYVGYRTFLESQIAILGPSGINYYDIVTGNQVVPPFDPVISGGEFDGLRFSQLEPSNFGGFRDGAAGQILLVPEPGFSSALLLATIGLMGRRRATWIARRAMRSSG